MKIPSLSFNSQKFARILTELKGTARLISKSDLAVLLALPCIITLLMFFPSNVHGLLVLQSKNPSWWQYFTSNFVHANVAHYFSNLIAYFIFIIPQLLVLTKITEKKNYLYLITILASSFFLVTYISHIISPAYFQKAQTSEGLSGIISGILGFTPFILVLFASKKIGKNLLKDGMLMIFLLYVVFLILLIYFPYHQNVLYVCIIFALMMGYAYHDKNEIFEIWNQIRSEKTDSPSDYCILIFLLLFFIASPAFMFPQNPVMNGSFVDVLTHYLGYLYGGLCFFCYYKFVPTLREHFKI